MDSQIQRKVNSEVLTQVEELFQEDFDPSTFFYAFLTSKRPPIIETQQSRDLQTVTKQSQRVQELFAILRTVPQSLDALIEWFETRHKSQNHLLERLKTLKQQEMDKYNNANVSQQNSSNSTSPTSIELNKMMITQANILDLVSIIIEDPIALNSWKTVMYYLIKQPTHYSDIETMIANREPIHNVIRMTLLYYLNETKTDSGPTLHDLTQILKEKSKLTNLAVTLQENSVKIWKD